MIFGGLSLFKGCMSHAGPSPVQGLNLALQTERVSEQKPWSLPNTARAAPSLTQKGSMSVSGKRETWVSQRAVSSSIKRGFMRLPWRLSGKESACQAGDVGSIPGSRRFLWRRKWQPTPVFLPEELHGQRSLEGYSPWGRKESEHNLVIK